MLIKSRRIKWMGHILVELMRDVNNMYRIIVKKPEGKISLWRPRPRSKYELKQTFKKQMRIILRRILRKLDVDWIHLVHNRVNLQDFVNTVMNLECHNRWEIY
jgi:hypothetical protein